MYARQIHTLPLSYAPPFHCVCVRVHVWVCSMGYGFEILPGEQVSGLVTEFRSSTASPRLSWLLNKHGKGGLLQTYCTDEDIEATQGTEQVSQQWLDVWLLLQSFVSTTKPLSPKGGTQSQQGSGGGKGRLGWGEEPRLGLLCGFLPAGPAFLS